MTTRLFAALDVYTDRGARSAATNMAIDEALLECVTVPTIRFYRWQSPALSFGYFGRFAHVASYGIERDLVRRWTGGGIVFHGEDLTYSIVIPTSDPVFAESSMSIYENVHSALVEALTGIGKHAVIAGGCSSRRSPKAEADDPGGIAVPMRAGVSASGYKCFANPVRADVLINGRKAAGAAQRRTRAGLLQQGSIQGVDLGNRLADRFALSLSANCREHKINEGILTRAQEIAERKYGNDLWLRKR